MLLERSGQLRGESPHSSANSQGSAPSQDARASSHQRAPSAVHIPRWAHSPWTQNGPRAACSRPCAHAEWLAASRRARVDDGMQPRLRRRFAMTANCAAIEINFQQIVWGKRAFIEASWSNPNVAAQAHAEVAAGGRNPALRVAPARRRAQGVDLGRNRIRA